MADAMYSLVNEAKKNKFAAIGTVLSDDDVVSVWENVSNFIEKQMSQHKGVNIPGLGIFTFSQKKLDVGNNKYILIQRPVFLLSEKFAQTHNLQHRKHHVTGQIPVVQLNFTALSFESPFDRDSVEACVKEVLQALSRSIGSMKNVEFLFQGIGKLHIGDSKVKMKFYKDFLSSMDGTGQLIKAVKDRRSMQDSVLSECSSRSSSWAILNVDQTPTKICALVLPKISPSPTEYLKPGRFSPAEPRAEVEEGNGDNMTQMTEAIDDGNQVEAQQDSDRHKDDIISEDENKTSEEFSFESSEYEDIFDLSKSPDSVACDKLPTPPGRASSTNDVTKRTISPKDDRFRKSITPTRVDTPTKGQTPVMYAKRSLSPIKAQSTVKTPPSTPQEKKPSNRSSSENEVLLKKPNLLPKRLTPPIEKRMITPKIDCGHTDAGQELCYLCHQRDRLNVPVPLAAARKHLENEEDRLLQIYNHVKDSDATMKEHETMLAKRHESKKRAAFNLGVSEALKLEKHARDTDFHSSYVFQNRPSTPPRFLKQERYFNELKEQVVLQDDFYKMHKNEDDLLERIEQVQLAEDLALQREEYLKEKAEQTEQYKKALSAQILVRDRLKSPNSQLKIRENKQMTPPTLPRPQIILPFSETMALKILNGSKVVRYKPLPVPVHLPDSVEPVFGKDNTEKLLEKRRLAHEVYQEQLNTVEQRKRHAILKQISDQRDEEAMLDKCKQELLHDRAEKYGRMFKNRKMLEEDWSKAHDNKYLRERDDKARFQSPALLLHEQCDRYKRCAQCKRRVSNCGETNIWKDSRYIPGSRLMV